MSFLYFGNIFANFHPNFIICDNYYLKVILVDAGNQLILYMAGSNVTVADDELM